MDSSSEIIMEYVLEETGEDTVNGIFNDLTVCVG